MTDTISTLLPYGVLVSHVVFVFIIAAYLNRKSWGRGVCEFVARRSVALSLLVASGAVLGSLFYSGVVGYAPCELCWWQRVFLYPQVILFLTALKTQDKKVFAYSVRLSILALLVSLYQLYVQYGGHSFLACTSVGGACTKVYVNAFGYITIPMMSVTVSLYLLLIAFIARTNDQDNRYA